MLLKDQHGRRDGDKTFPFGRLLRNHLLGNGRRDRQDLADRTDTVNNALIFPSRDIAAQCPAGQRMKAIIASVGGRVASGSAEAVPRCLSHLRKIS